MKIAFIAPQQYHQSFALLGFDCFAAKTEKETSALIEQFQREEKFALIFASEDVFAKKIPGVITLPGLVRRRQEAYLKEEIERAVGKELPIKQGAENNQ